MALSGHPNGITSALRPNGTQIAVNERRLKMRSPVYNLFTEDARGNPVWLDAVADFEAARIRLTQLASVNPGEYFIFNLRTQQIVTRLVSTIEEITQT
jgi:hypothetical protein